MERKLGEGRIVVLGALPKGGLGPVFDDILKDLPIQRYPASWGSMAIPRGKNHQVLIAVNLDGKGGWVEIPRTGKDLASGKPIPAGRLTLEPYGVRMIGLGNDVSDSGILV